MKSALRVNPATVTTILAVLLAVVTLLAYTSDARAGTTLVVNSVGDTADVDPQDGVCDADGTVAGDQCTLRAAIQQANAASGADAIQFDIPATGLQTIRLASSLPTLTDTSGPTTIDGYTQPGSSANTSARASNARIMVQIEGAGDRAFGGLTIESPGNVVRGLAFYNLAGGILLSGFGAHDNRIEGNFLGTNSAGTHRATVYIRGGYASGVRLTSGASSNTIGGTTPASRNVISGNASHGVGIYPRRTDSNVVVGNIIGLTPSGNAQLANQAVGVDINYGSSYNVVGGTLRGERNVISGNGREGVEVSHHADIPETFPVANRVIGNFVGTSLSGEASPTFAHNGSAPENYDGVHLVDGARDSVVAYNVVAGAERSGVSVDGAGVANADGSPTTTGNKVYDNRIGVSPGGAALPNAVAGIHVVSGATNTQVGPRNVVANNRTGVKVANSLSARITSNSIYSNSGLGIDLSPVGRINKNDHLDPDEGTNRGQNFPVLNSAKTSGGVSTIRGTLDSKRSKTFRIEFFANPRGTDEGKTYIGYKNVTTGTDGKVIFAFRPAGAVSPGRAVTATATDSAGNTSEFSAPRAVARG